MSFLSKIGLGAVDKVFGAATEWVSAWQERKTAQMEHKMEIEQAKAEAKIAMAKNAQDHKFEWEEQAIKNAGWKDDWMVLVLTVPAVLVFFPQLQGSIKEGFTVLKELPDWYQYGLMTVIGSSFGVKKWTDFKKMKKLLG